MHFIVRPSTYVGRVLSTVWKRGTPPLPKRVLTSLRLPEVQDDTRVAPFFSPTKLFFEVSYFEVLVSRESRVDSSRSCMLLSLLPLFCCCYSRNSTATTTEDSVMSIQFRAFHHHENDDTFDLGMRTTS
jgi:hypothetical protein